MSKGLYIGVKPCTDIEIMPLPEGYTQVEYIESTGTQYIDTRVSANSNIRFTVDVTPLEVVGYSLLGYYYSASDSFRLFNANSKVYVDYGDTSASRL